LIAENLFLRKQLAFFTERKVKPRRIARLAMIALARFIDWRGALVIVKPETFTRWHRTAFRMFWQWKSRKRGRPSLPKNLKELIRQMARLAGWGKIGGPLKRSARVHEVLKEAPKPLLKIVPKRLIQIAVVTQHLDDGFKFGAFGDSGPDEVTPQLVDRGQSLPASRLVNSQYSR
jgi:hypothetical protein